MALDVLRRSCYDDGEASDFLGFFCCRGQRERERDGEEEEKQKETCWGEQVGKWPSHLSLLKHLMHSPEISSKFFHSRPKSFWFQDVSIYLLWFHTDFTHKKHADLPLISAHSTMLQKRDLRPKLSAYPRRSSSPEGGHLADFSTQRSEGLY